jgi:hypothetical protein
VDLPKKEKNEKNEKSKPEILSPKPLQSEINIDVFDE